MKNFLITILLLIIGTLLLAQIGVFKMSKSVSRQADNTAASDENASSQDGEEDLQSNKVIDARAATVSIKSDLGLGAGFFVSSECFILTNKHVVSFDEKKMDHILERLESTNESLRQLSNIIADKHDQFTSQCSDCSQEARENNISNEMQKHGKLSTIIDDAEEKIYNLKYKLIYEVTLGNEEKYTGHLIEISDNYDLALMKINEVDCPFLQKGDAENLNYGDTIYAIGNPSGFGHTVSSGVFSRIEGDGAKRMIQTDASVNPGSSGGPIVNDEGLVFGVVTLKRMDLEGIGFAIPISIAFEEFSEHLE